MAVFAHRQGGAGAALSLLRGVIVGGFASLSFLIVIALFVERSDLLIVYLLAIGAAIAEDEFLTWSTDGSSSTLKAAPWSWRPGRASSFLEEFFIGHGRRSAP